MELAESVSAPKVSLRFPLKAREPPASVTPAELFAESSAVTRREPPVVTTICEVLPSALAAAATSVPELTVEVPE